MRYQITYSYLATGMEGRAQVEDYGVFEADSPAEACDKAVLARHPVDEMYGPNKAWSTRDFVRRCLGAAPVEP